MKDELEGLSRDALKARVKAAENTAQRLHNENLDLRSDRQNLRAENERLQSELATSPNYRGAVEQMLAHEQSGGDGWWKGWGLLKAAHQRAVTIGKNGK